MIIQFQGSQYKQKQITQRQWWIIFCQIVLFMLLNSLNILFYQFFNFKNFFLMVYVDISAYLFACLGGALLGISTTLNYMLRGKVTGMSGILFSLASFNKKQLPEKLTLVGGMLFISGCFYDIFGYSSTNISPFGAKNQITTGLSYYGYILAGFLVGMGTKLANGCTSGHGLCGLGRLSQRSMVAVCVFVFTAIGISTLSYYQSLGFITNNTLNPVVNIDNLITANIFMVIGMIMPIISFFVAKKNHGEHFKAKIFLIDNIIVLLVGILFGLGLMISGMTRRAKIQAFLQMNQNWDPSLLIVLLTGVTINVISFNYMIYVKKQPYLRKKLFNPSHNKIDSKLIIGAFLFGLGWGIGSLCPGPFMMLFSVFTIQIQILWGTSCILGMYLIYYLTLPKNQTPTDTHPNVSSDPQAASDHNHNLQLEHNMIVPQSDQNKI